jgi:hypothetical protein
MPTVRVDDLYDLEIRGLPLPDRLRLAQRILGDVATEAAAETGPSRSLLDLEGLGAELWGSVDAQDYVDGLREEWNSQP